MRSLLGLAVMVTLFASSALARPSPAPACLVHFTVIKYDGRLFAFGQLSDAQQKWWTTKGAKKYKQACLDADAPWPDGEYFVVWGAEVENRAALAFVYHPGTTGTGTVQLSNGDTGTVTTTTPATTEAVPTVRTVSRVHLYVFAWRDGKLDGPIWMTDRAGEGWWERGWNQTHPASLQLLDDALKFLTAKMRAGIS